MAQTFEELEAWRKHYKGALVRAALDGDASRSCRVLRELQRVERRMRVVKTREDHGAKLAGLDRGDRRLAARRHRRRVRL